MNALPPELRDRVMKAAADASTRPSPSPRRRVLTGALLVAGCTVAGVLLAFGIGAALHWHSINAGGPGAPPRPIALLAETLAGGLLVGVAAIYAAAARGRSMIGRSRQVMAAAAVLAPLAVFTWKIAVGAQVPGLEASDYGALGLKCMTISFATGALPFFALLWLRRYSDPVHPGFAGAGLGLSIGMLTWLVVDVWCPVCYVPHLLLGHVLPTAAFITVGAIAGAVFLRLRPLPRP